MIALTTMTSARPRANTSATGDSSSEQARCRCTSGDTHQHQRGDRLHGRRRPRPIAPQAQLAAGQQQAPAGGRGQQRRPPTATPRLRATASHSAGVGDHRADRPGERHATARPRAAAATNAAAASSTAASSDAPAQASRSGRSCGRCAVGVSGTSWTKRWPAADQHAADRDLQEGELDRLAQVEIEAHGLIDRRPRSCCWPGRRRASARPRSW